MDEQQKLLTIFTPDWQSRLMLITSDMPTTVPTEQFLKSLPKHMLESDPPQLQPPPPPHKEAGFGNTNPPGYSKRMNKHRNSDGNGINNSSGCGPPPGFPPPVFCQPPLPPQPYYDYVLNNNANLCPLGHRPPYPQQQLSPPHGSDKYFFNNNKTAMHSSFNSPMSNNPTMKRPRMPMFQSPPRNFDGPVFMSSSLHHHLPKPPPQRPLTEMFNVKYKTSLCKSFTEYRGCKYGVSCLFAHGAGELRTMTFHNNNNNNQQATRKGSVDTQ